MPARVAAPAAGGAVKAGVVALFLGAMAIGFAPIFVRLSEVGPTATAFWRVALAFPPLLLWARLAPSGTASPARHGRALALAGIFFAADLTVWHLSLGLTLVANATLEANLSAIFVPLLGWLLFRQRVSRRFALAVAVAVAGVVILVGKNAHISARSLHGDALGVLTAVFYSGYILSVKAARDEGVGTAVIMAVSALVSAVALLAVVAVRHETLLPHGARGWAVLAALALISHVGGQGLITYSLAALPAPVVSVGLLAQPATAAFAAWWLLGETLVPAQWLGAAILLIGLWLARPAASGPRRKFSPGGVGT